MHTERKANKVNVINKYQELANKCFNNVIDCKDADPELMTYGYKSFTSILEYQKFYNRQQFEIFIFLMVAYSQENRNSHFLEDAHKTLQKLIKLFSTPDNIHKFLRDFADYNSDQPIHNACLFTLPDTDDWSPSEWQKLVTKLGKKILPILPFAPHIEKAMLVNNKQFAELSLNDIYHYKSSLNYKKWQDHPELAGLCTEHHITEKVFEECLDIVKYRLKKLDFLPEINIKGQQVHKDFKKYSFVKLSAKDLRGLFLGNYTGCCQTIGNAGGSCAEMGMTSPYAGFYVIVDNKNQIVAQTFSWMGKKGVIVFDSFESRGKNYDNVIKAFVTYSADHFLKAGFNAVHVGRGGNTPKILSESLPIAEDTKCIDTLGYSDAYQQVVIKRKDARLSSTELLSNFDSKEIQQTTCHLMRAGMHPLELLSSAKEYDRAIKFVDELTQQDFIMLLQINDPSTAAPFGYHVTDINAANFRRYVLTRLGIEVFINEKIVPMHLAIKSNAKEFIVDLLDCIAKHKSTLFFKEDFYTNLFGQIDKAGRNILHTIVENEAELLHLLPILFPLSPMESSKIYHINISSQFFKLLTSFDKAGFSPLHSAIKRKALNFVKYMQQYSLNNLSSDFTLTDYFNKIISQRTTCEDYCEKDQNILQICLSNLIPNDILNIIFANDASHEGDLSVIQKNTLRELLKGTGERDALLRAALNKTDTNFINFCLGIFKVELITLFLSENNCHTYRDEYFQKIMSQIISFYEPEILKQEFLKSMANPEGTWLNGAINENFDMDSFMLIFNLVEKLLELVKDKSVVQKLLYYHPLSGTLALNQAIQSRTQPFAEAFSLYKKYFTQEELVKMLLEPVILNQETPWMAASHCFHASKVLEALVLYCGSAITFSHLEVAAVLAAKHDKEDILDYILNLKLESKDLPSEWQKTLCWLALATIEKNQKLSFYGNVLDVICKFVEKNNLINEFKNKILAEDKAGSMFLQRRASAVKTTKLDVSVEYIIYYLSSIKKNLPDSDSLHYEFISKPDAQGDTLIHFASQSDNVPLIIACLAFCPLENRKALVTLKNNKGVSATDICQHIPSYVDIAFAIDYVKDFKIKLSKTMQLEQNTGTSFATLSEARFDCEIRRCSFINLNYDSMISNYSFNVHTLYRDVSEWVERNNEGYLAACKDISTAFDSELKLTPVTIKTLQTFFNEGILSWDHIRCIRFVGADLIECIVSDYFRMAMKENLITVEQALAIAPDHLKELLTEQGLEAIRTQKILNIKPTLLEILKKRLHSCREGNARKDIIIKDLIEKNICEAPRIENIIKFPGYSFSLFQPVKPACSSVDYVAKKLNAI